MEPWNLRRLRQLRADHQAPAMPIFVVPNRRDEDRFTALGALAINCRPADHDADWSPVAGLDVILVLPEYSEWTELVLAVRDKGRPRMLRNYVYGYGFTYDWDPK